MKTKPLLLAILATMVVGGTALAQRGARNTAQVRYLKTEMTTGIRQGSTPHLEIVPHGAGVRVLSDRKADYGSGKASTFKVTGLKSGKLGLTLLLPVSGHVSWSEAQRYAKSNRYNISMKYADGSSKALGKVKSTGLVTTHDATFTLKKGKNVLDFWPDGSGGVYGYLEGRRIEISWDGK